MRSDWLVFLHIVAAATLIGGLFAVAVLSAGNAAGRITFRSSVLVLVAAFATVAIGEAARAREDASGTWLDIGSALGYAGLLLPSAALVALARRARDSHWLTWLAAVMILAAFAAAFVMAGKPS